MALRFIDEVDSDAISASSTIRLALPTVNWLSAWMLHADITIGVSSGSVTVVNSTLGAIPLFSRIRMQVEGNPILVDISGKYLDLWSRIDRPSSERFVQTSTTDDDPWDALLRYEVAQSEANPVGSMPMWLYEDATIEVETAAVTTIATGTGVAVSGTLRLMAEQYDQASQFVLPDANGPAANLKVASVLHRLTQFRHDLPGSGQQSVSLKGYVGDALERLLAVAVNNSADTYGLIDRISFMRDQQHPLRRHRTEQMQGELLAKYGGENMPITGTYAWDFRRAGQNDIVPLGDKYVARDPHLLAEVNTSVSLTSPRLDVIVETLQAVNRNAQAVLAPIAA
ncbi:MAG: hypothetical protein AB7T16_13320 [Dehalococcoidia bacterium]